MMNKFLLSILGVFFSLVTYAQTNITGTISDGANQTPIPGASIVIKGTVLGSIADGNGKFSIKTKQAYPITLSVTAIGYSSQQVEVKDASPISIALKGDIEILSEVTVSGNRVEEALTKAAVTIEKLDIRKITQSASADVYGALQALKGVDLLSQNMIFRSVNMRGFGANNNNRFVQLTDGMDNRSPGYGFGFGNVAGVSDIDIESIEILPGASSALYGPDALQGLMLTNTKSPFDYQGFSAQIKGGVNNVGKSNMSASPYSDIALRYAQQVGDKFAFKVNFQAINGTDFIADDFSDRSHRGRPGFFVVDNTAKTIGLGYVPNNNPATNFAYDGVNIYGDDFNNGGAFTFPATYPTAPALAGKPVTRTGYTELDLLNNNGKIFSYRANAAVHYKINDKVEAVAAWYFGNGNLVRTAGFREYYPDYLRNQFKLELKGDNFFLRGYNTSQQAEGYNLGQLSARMLQLWKPTAAWGADFGRAYGANADITAARNAADIGKPMPGDATFTKNYADLSNTLTTDFIPGSTTIRGVRVLDNSSMRHFEGMYNFKNILPKFLEVVTGASFRKYDLLTKGTIFPKAKDGKEFTIKEYGWYLQASPTIKISEKASLKPTVAVRYDKNEYFKGGFTPRLSGVLTLGEHNFRGSWQSAFRNPSPNQLLADGNIGEVGGSEVALTSANLFANPAYTEASANAFTASITAANPAGNPAVLVKYVPNPAAFTTEKIKTWEVGYKTLIRNKLFIDAFYYSSVYNDFIATQNYRQPTTGQAIDLRSSTSYKTYQINFNNFNQIYVTGWGLGAEYALGKGYNIAVNYANQIGKVTLRDNAGNIVKDAFGTEIIKRKMSDPTVARVQRNFFISPENRYNITFSNPKVTEKIGFTVNYRWTDTMWVEQGTTAGDIMLPSWTSLDAAVSYKLPKKFKLKVGGSNILNKYYSQGYGLARIGGLYYVSVSYN